MRGGKTIAVTGMGGLVGKALKPLLEDRGHRVFGIARGGGTTAPLSWNPLDGVGVFEAEGSPHTVDVVVHLAGAPLRPRWSERMRRDVYDSRVAGARMLVTWLRQRAPSATVVVASGVGVYGTRPSDWDGPAFTETSPTAPRDQTLLVRTSLDAEAVWNEYARESGARVVHARFGVVLSPRGGALAAMLPAFRLGLGGPMGPGTQRFAWISLEDCARALLFAVEDDALVGPVNFVSPGSPRTSQGRFAVALGNALGRPAALRIPAAVLRVALGRESADAMLLSSVKIEPAALTKVGFPFRHVEIEDCLAQILSEPAGAASPST